MASEAQKLRANRLYIESADPQSDSALAAACGIDRETVKRARVAGNWELQRAEYWHRATSARTSAAVATQATGQVLTAIRRREILREIAECSEHKASERVAALKLDAELDLPVPAGGVGAESDSDGPPRRFVVVDPGE